MVVSVEVALTADSGRVSVRDTSLYVTLVPERERRWVLQRALMHIRTELDSMDARTDPGEVTE